MKRNTVWLIFLGILVIFVVNIIRASKWDGSRRFTVVVNSNPLMVFSIEPKSKRAVLIVLPSNTLLDVPYGYNTYLAHSVYRLGQLDNLRSGGMLLTGSIEKTLGVIVDGYFAREEDMFLLPETAELVRLKKSHFSISGIIFSVPKFFKIKGKIQTNLPLLDIIRLWNAIREIRSDKIVFLEPVKTNVLTQELLPDKTPVYVFDKELFDALIADRFQDQLIRSQNISLEVVNAAKKERVAAEFSRILINLGASVVLKTTAVSNESQACLIIVSNDNLLKSFVVKRLVQHYQCRVAPASSVTGQADVKIVLGEAFIR